MGNTIFIFNGWGLLALSVFTFAYASSHIFAVKGLKNADRYTKLIGFVAFISIFFVSGWKASLIAIPIGLLGSFIGAALAGSLRN
jgi:hypothetical protein